MPKCVTLSLTAHPLAPRPWALFRQRRQDAQEWVALGWTVVGV